MAALSKSVAGMQCRCAVQQMEYYFCESGAAVLLIPIFLFSFAPTPVQGNRVNPLFTLLTLFMPCFLVPGVRLSWLWIDMHLCWR